MYAIQAAAWGTGKGGGRRGRAWGGLAAATVRTPHSSVAPCVGLARFGPATQACPAMASSHPLLSPVPQQALPNCPPSMGSFKIILRLAAPFEARSHNLPFILSFRFVVVRRNSSQPVCQWILRSRFCNSLLGLACYVSCFPFPQQRAENMGCDARNSSTCRLCRPMLNKVHDSSRSQSALLHDDQRWCSNRFLQRHNSMRLRLRQQRS